VVLGGIEGMLSLFAHVKGMSNGNGGADYSEGKKDLESLKGPAGNHPTYPDQPGPVNNLAC